MQRCGPVIFHTITSRSTPAIEVRQPAGSDAIELWPRKFGQVFEPSGGGWRGLCTGQILEDSREGRPINSGQICEIAERNAFSLIHLEYGFFVAGASMINENLFAMFAAIR